MPNNFSDKWSSRLISAARISLTAALLSVSPAAKAQDLSEGMTLAKAAADAEQQLQQSFTNLQFEDFGPAPVKGPIFQASAGGRIVYYAPESEHLLFASIFDKNGVNLTALAQEAGTAKRLKAIDTALAFAIGPENAPTVIEFTDPDCPYCRALDRYWAAKAAEGIPGSKPASSLDGDPGLPPALPGAVPEYPPEPGEAEGMAGEIPAPPMPPAAPPAPPAPPVEKTVGAIGAAVSAPGAAAAADGKAAPGGAKKKTRTIYLPPGFMKARLLTGIDALASRDATSNPEPLIARVQAPAVLPNDVKANLSGCFVIGNATGSLAKERVEVQLVSLSCVDFDERSVVDQPIKGFFVDTDGKKGLSGKVVTRAGASLARAFIAGTISGISQTVENTVGEVSTSALGSVRSLDAGDAAKAGIAGGLSKSSDKLTDFYLDLARQAGPIVEVGAAKDVVVVIQEGVTLEIKPTAGSKF